MQLRTEETTQGRDSRVRLSESSRRAVPVVGLGEEEAEMMLRCFSLENGEDKGHGGGLHQIRGEY